MEEVATDRDVFSSSSLDDDDGSLSGLAVEAALFFQSGKFSDCLKVLHQILLKKEGDSKVLHNISLADNLQDGCSDPKRLIEQLTIVKKRSEELACASTSHSEPASNAETPAVEGIKGNSSASQQHSALHNLIIYTDECDTSVTMYNLAVCWFHLHEYAKSFLILEALFKNIEPIDEETAKCICLLLLDVALLTQNVARSDYSTFPDARPARIAGINLMHLRSPQKEEAQRFLFRVSSFQNVPKYIPCYQEVISYIEKIFCNNSLLNQVENVNSTEAPPSTVVGKSDLLPSNPTIPDAPNQDSPAAGISSEGSLSRTLTDEGLEDDALHLISSMEIGGQNLPRKLGLQSSNYLRRSQADEFSNADMRIKLHLCKVRFLLLTRNLKAAKREVKMAMNTARGKDYSMALYLKSQLEYARGNHQKAIKLLIASSDRTEMGISSIYYNNLGCIYYQLGKRHTSALFFTKALSNCSAVRKEKPLNLSTISQDRSLLITYNCGMQYLDSGRPVQAAHCFYKASLVFYNRPLLWLRIAECCLMAIQKGLIKSSTAPSAERSEVRVRVVGKGKWRQLVLEDGVSGNGLDNLLSVKDLVIRDGKPTISVSLARQCLLNALHLMHGSESKYNQSTLPHTSVLEDNETGEAVSSKNTKYKNGSTGDQKAPNVEVSGQVSANEEVKLKERRVGSSQNASLLSSICEYKDHCKKENLMIEQALLADLAFVELELGNPLKALIAARSLLKVLECNRIYIFLGNVYAAEALCLLNRPKEAAEHLSMYISHGKDVDVPYSPEDSEIWRLEKTLDSEDSNSGSATSSSSPPEDFEQSVFPNPEEARGILFSNLAAMSAMQGDIELAQYFSVKALSMKPQCIEAILTAVYVDLLCGRTQEALTKLKHCSCIRFMPGSLTLIG
ncbi:hypothetical protein RND71_034517 [Anisodus tanguticus]|uniref:CCR4-NOT transcription complex subunit 10 n=1 Tax=Anisodus tanguticus TaxID=243964 RepID=A0AAE1RAV7_9SOLA|nr:hypothetical protein RND71_034517 [Anisodus tanguticus]